MSLDHFCVMFDFDCGSRDSVCRHLVPVLLCVTYSGLVPQNGSSFLHVFPWVDTVLPSATYAAC
jgi:hypothetical protein